MHFKLVKVTARVLHMTPYFLRVPRIIPNVRCETEDQAEKPPSQETCSLQSCPVWTTGKWSTVSGGGIHILSCSPLQLLT